jgi:hypothetical protein
VFYKDYLELKLVKNLKLKFGNMRFRSLVSMHVEYLVVRDILVYNLNTLQWSHVLSNFFSFIEAVNIFSPCYI